VKKPGATIPRRKAGVQPRVIYARTPSRRINARTPKTPNTPTQRKNARKRKRPRATETDVHEKPAPRDSFERFVIRARKRRGRIRAYVMRGFTPAYRRGTVARIFSRRFRRRSCARAPFPFLKAPR